MESVKGKTAYEMQSEVELTNLSKDKFTYQNISRPVELQFKLNNFSLSAFKFD